VLLSALLALLIASTGFDAATAVALQGLTALCALGVCVWLFLKSTPEGWKTARVSERPSGWTRTGATMLATEIMRVLDGQYAILLLGAIAAQHDVGVFRVALSIATFVGLPASLINVIVMPHLAELHARGDRSRLQLVAAGAALFTFVSIFIAAILVALIGDQIIVLAFGSAFSGAWAPLLIMSGSYLLTGFFGSAAMILNMCGAERTVTAVYTAGPIIGFTVAVGLYSHLGMPAAAVGTLVAEAVKGAWMYVAAKRKLGIDVSLLGARSLLPGAARTHGQ